MPEVTYTVSIEANRETLFRSARFDITMVSNTSPSIETSYYNLTRAHAWDILIKRGCDSRRIEEALRSALKRYDLVGRTPIKENQ